VFLNCLINSSLWLRCFVGVSVLWCVGVVCVCVCVSVCVLAFLRVGVGSIWCVSMCMWVCSIGV